MRHTKIANFVRRAKVHALYNYLPPLVDWAVRQATVPARKRIVQSSATRLLVDNTTIAHAVTHETYWINTGRKYWGGKVAIDTGYTARIPVHSEADNSDPARSVRFFPTIASLARQGTIKLFTSPELIDERMTHRMGMFTGYGWNDFSMFSGLRMERLADPTYHMIIGPTGLGYSPLEDQRRDRLAAKSDPLFRSLCAVLGPKNSQDAWHITTAEQNACFCFLTMDFSLLRAMAAQRKNPVVASLKTRVLSPEQFGMLFGLRPISPRLYSYHRASYPVRADLNSPDSTRQKRQRSVQQ